MYPIEFYETLNAKREYFRYSKPIESIEDFDRIWDLFASYKKGNGLIYRGVKKASYKIYSSAQREWNESNYVDRDINGFTITGNGIPFKEYISSTILNAKADIKIQKHFSENGISLNNDLAYLSFLQHHYKPNETPPTTLIDFTFNPFIALYFAFELSSNSDCKFETENYCSVYFVNCNYIFLSGYQNLFYSFINGRPTDKLSYSQFHLTPFFHLHTENDSFRIVNSNRIINQEGTFFVNTCDKFPIEKNYKLAIDFARSENRVPENAPSQLFFCHDFNTNLREYALNRLEKEMGITKDFIYPLP